MASPGERLVWLEIKRDAEDSSARRAKAEDIRAKKCPQCGWLDKPEVTECFRCGYVFEGAAAFADMLRSEGVEPPSVEIKVAAGFRELIRKNRRDPLEHVRLRLAGERRRLVQGFDQLLSLDEVNIARFDHQIETARRALNELRGQALLADEVGLGKTIEAGIILKELVVRGLARRVLILAPASLLTQWREEMFNKFGETFRVAARVDDWAESKVIGSLSLAKRGEHARAILAQSYDLLIVDEAHHLKNRSSQVFKFVNQIRKKYVLLLTATPVHNDLIELYNLVTILKPGLLGTVRAFRRHFVSEADPRKPNEPGQLKALLREVMIRNRRAHVGVKLPARQAAVYHLQFAEDERRLYDDVTRYVKDELRRRGRDQRYVLSLITLQRELCSSPEATRATLERLRRRPPLSDGVRAQLDGFIERCSRLNRPRKAAALEEILERFPERTLVFTEFLHTLRMLKAMLEARGLHVVPFHGSLDVRRRREAIAEFEADPRSVMVSTQAGGEGLNFQFCRQIVNYDLPWNPMRVEQRIGRVHRLGQTRDVRVFNFAVAGTVEERVIDLLANKIKMFELVIGELDLILGAMDARKSFEQQIAEIFVTAQNEEEMDRKFDELGRRILEARRKYERVKETESMLSDIAEI